MIWCIKTYIIAYVKTQKKDLLSIMYYYYYDIMYNNRSIVRTYFIFLLSLMFHS